MRTFLKAVKGIFFKRISTDELKIFDLVAARLPLSVAAKLRTQVNAIEASVPMGDEKTIAYKLNPEKIKGSAFIGFGRGIQEFGRIVICLNEVEQPFTIYVLDGFLHSLKIRNPHPLKRSGREFDVISFEYDRADARNLQRELPDL